MYEIHRETRRRMYEIHRETRWKNRGEEEIRPGRVEIKKLKK